MNLPQGTEAIYDRATKNVVCLDCASAPSPTTEPVAVDPVQPAPANTVEDAAIEPGSAGASPHREYERRSAKREERIRERHPKLGGLILALSDEPQSTTAWRTGAKGEELLGKRLDGLIEQGVRVLHDRRIPGTRANIDHIAVSSAGVFVLDAKRYKGRPELRVEGGILRPRTETLIVGSRKCNPLVDGIAKQTGLVTAALEREGLAGIPVTGMLVFVDADWPLFGGDFTTQGVKVLWPKKAVEHLTKPGGISREGVEDMHRLLAGAFSAA